MAGCRPPAVQQPEREHSCGSVFASEQQQVPSPRARSLEAHTQGKKEKGSSVPRLFRCLELILFTLTAPTPAAGRGRREEGSADAQATRRDATPAADGRHQGHLRWPQQKPVR